MIDIMEFITVQKGQNIVTQGDDASEMYIITNECSCVVKVNGKEVRTFKQYDTIGEKSLMKGNHIRGASVTAITDAQLLVLSRVKFDSLNINSDSFNNRVERSSVMYRDVDDARMKAMLNSGERVDEGETSAI
jgi:CRP-like cAMP-binding protein